MLISGQGKAYTGRQRWWREKRLPQVEDRAYALIREHERRYGKLPGCIIQPELLLPTAGCEYYYFRDDEREKLGYTRDKLARLIGMTTDYVALVEESRRDLELSEMVLIARALRISLSTLLALAESALPEA